ncbi:MAG: fructose-bisphosphate aldolase [Candidatus Woesearchaeota archaeon]|nr:fructose-bisphosphate aldolase [Candidatus Woesearchaeota archaeon]
MTVHVKKLLRKGKCLILSYDEGLEHGPHEFNAKNVDPEWIFDLAYEARFSGIACHIGVAEKYHKGPYKDLPLIVKVNGSSKLPNISPISTQICSVERAVKAGASAIGFTMYDGSPNEPAMLESFGRIVEEAHAYNLPVIAWMYPRGPNINSQSNDILAYSVRMALELGADLVKVKYNGDSENLKWMVRCAGKTQVIVSAARKGSAIEFLDEAGVAMRSGVLGMATGRVLWQHKKPFTVAKALKAIVYDGKTAAEAAQLLR